MGLLSIPSTPDDMVYDPTSSDPMGVLECKNPYKFQDMTPVEAANQSTNCCLIEKNDSLSLKQTHTVGANKKFKNGMKFLLQRLSMHCLYGFRTVLECL